MPPRPDPAVRRQSGDETVGGAHGLVSRLSSHRRSRARERRRADRRTARRDGLGQEEAEGEGEGDVGVGVGMGANTPGHSAAASG